MIRNKYIVFFLLILGILSSGCKQTDLSEYNNPEGVYETYRRAAQTLRVVADHRFYRRAIRCFKKEDWEWFEENYDTIDIEKEEEVYQNLYRSKKLAYVMGKSVVPAGPPVDEENYSVEKINSGKAQIKVDNYPEKITLVKEGDKWVFEDLFGIKTSPGN
ncbi:MAG: hypothetical protein ACQEQC_02345 [Elusimicrobiota bacterium]